MNNGMWDHKKISNSRIREMVKEGKSDTEMAREFNCSASSIQRRRTKMKLAPAPGHKNQGQTSGPLQVITHHIDEIYARPWIS